MQKIVTAALVAGHTTAIGTVAASAAPYAVATQHADMPTTPLGHRLYSIKYIYRVRIR